MQPKAAFLFTMNNIETILLSLGIDVEKNMSAFCESFLSVHTYLHKYCKEEEFYDGDVISSEFVFECSDKKAYFFECEYVHNYNYFQSEMTIINQEPLTYTKLLAKSTESGSVVSSLETKLPLPPPYILN